jgi:23S rRNA pseudouridine1911/1915/1917 synthase
MRFTVKKDCILLDVVMEMHHGISKQKAKKLVASSNFLANGERIKNHPTLPISAGQVIEIERKPKGENLSKIPSKQNPISIVFEDKHFVIGLKPAGILSCHDRAQESAPSFHKHLEAFILNRDEKKLRLWPVHRLDKEVEGLIIFGKSEQYQQLLKDQWQNVTKKYLALTEGKPLEAKGVIENWLKDGPNQKVQCFAKEVADSKFAKTEYTFIRQEGMYSLLEITLHTGRKNQIRAHLSQIGCPIVGDRKYGADGSFIRQIRLAAYKINFNHPITNQEINLEYTPSAKFFKPSKNEDEKYRIL